MTRILSAVALICSLAGPVWADQDRLITTTGVGRVEAVPDMATIDIGVTHQAETAGDALLLTSDAMRMVIDTLQAAGIVSGDMQTRGVSVQPIWTRGPSNTEAEPRISGFVARNGLVIRVRDLGSLGGILDAVVSDGANTFNGLSFSLQDTSGALAEARERAVEDAMTKAQQLAGAAGVTLGPVRSISENGGARPVMMEMATARMASDVPVAAGEVSLSAQVTIVFEISGD